MGTHTPTLKATQYIGYWAGDDGKIYSRQGWRGREGFYPLVQIGNGRGYYKVRLKTARGRKSIAVHVLVMQAWLPPRPSPQHETRHLDGNRLNNLPSNLEWGTRQDNADDRETHGHTSRGRIHSEAIKRGLALRRHVL